MTAITGRADQRILDAVADFRQTSSLNEMWQLLHRHLAGFGVTGMLYGMAAFPNAKLEHDIMLTSLSPAYMKAKMSEQLYASDAFVQACLTETDPMLWSDASRLEQATSKTKRSLEVDWDYGVTTGVTLPTRFNNGFGKGGFGLHAADLSWAEFDRIWLEQGDVISAIAHGFDICIRQGGASEKFALAPRERECLLWLAIGLRPQQIAFRLGTHVKTVEKQIESARRKLNAATTVQAVVFALVYGLISP